MTACGYDIHSVFMRNEALSFFADGASSSQQASSGNPGQVKSKGALRRYIDSFDQQTMLQMARLVSAEGAQLVERQTCALFGNLKLLQRQMQVEC